MYTDVVLFSWCISCRSSIRITCDRLQKRFSCFFPVFSKQYWFVTAYIALYCIAPFINEAIEKINVLYYKRGLLVGFLLFYMWSTFCFLLNAPQLVEDSGYGIVNFVYLYLLGRYIRLYYEDRGSALSYIILYAFSCFLLFLSQYLLSRFLGFEYSSWLSYNTIFVFFAAIFLFMFFKNISIHIPIINVLAAPCLAVYLFHLTPYGWKYLVDILMIRNARNIVYVGMLLGYPFIIYIVGFCIEKIRLFMGTWLENRICTMVSMFIEKSCKGKSKS
ncbi:MAG: acyltransferase family protein [Bacteroidaceae bacterium]|nr:acyltransferase family protein [Bacteroidaceae bacterium]